MTGYLVVLGVALAATFVLTELARRLSLRIGAVQNPDERRVHEKPTPILGGAAMFGAFLAAMGVAWFMPDLRPVFEGSSAPLGVVLAAAVIFAVGQLDDLREVSAPAKMSGQVFAGSILYLFGVTLLFFRVPFADFVVLSPDLAPLVTVLWLVGMVNAVNFIDGLDGLAAGIVGIAAAAYFLYTDRLTDAGLLGPDSISPLLAVIVLGICLGFLPHNFHPARIFMGDAGAYLLGLLMASATIMVGGQTVDQFSGQTFFFFAPLFIPLIILGVPIFDTAYAIVRRAVRRTPIATAPDKQHLHHRLMSLGHGQRRSVLILWSWTAILSGMVLYPAYTGRGNGVVPFGVLALGVTLYAVLHPQARRGRENGRAEPRALARGEPTVAGRAQSAGSARPAPPD